MKGRLTTCIILGFLILFSCTKQIDDSILDIEEEELLAPGEELPEELSAQNSILAVNNVSLGGSEVTDFTFNIMEVDRFVEIDLPMNSNLSSVSIDFELSENATQKFSSTGLNFTNTGITLVTVVAENGDEKPYTVRVTTLGDTDPMESPNEITAITSIIDNVNGINVSLENTDIEFIDNDIKIELPVGTAITDLSFVFDFTETSTLLDEATNLNFEGRNQNISLEGENEDIRIYTLEVSVTEDTNLSDENEIISITLSTGDAPNTTIVYENDNPAFESNAINIELPFKTDVSDLDIAFTFSDDFATLAEGTLTEGLDFSSANAKMFEVVAQNGDPRLYEIGSYYHQPTERLYWKCITQMELIRQKDHCGI